MDINVNVKLSGDLKLMMSLATLVQCIQDVLRVSNAQLATEKTAESLTAVPEPVEQRICERSIRHGIFRSGNKDARSR